MIFAEGERMLVEAGIRLDSISRAAHLAVGKTISQMVLDVQREGDFGTVVVGKRGVSKAEEFLFGSISNALIHNGRDIAVWVIG